MKKLTITLTCILFSVCWTFLEAQTCTECLLTDRIKITTGRDHYQVNAAVWDLPVFWGRDEFWSVRGGPNNAGPYPKCAYGRGSNNTISVNANGVAPATHTVLCHWTAVRVARDYTLEREFRVCRSDLACDIDLTIGELSFAHNGSETGIASVRIIGPNGSGIFTPLNLSNCANPAGLTPVTSQTTINNVPDGVYTLQALIRNNAAGINASALNFNIEGDVWTNSTTCGAGTEALVENAHFGKRVAPAAGSCAPAYDACSYRYEVDLLGNRCIPTNSTGTFTIDQYCPDSDYTFDDGVNPPIIANSATVVLAPGNYTLTVRDARGCEYSKTIDIGEPTLSVTAITPCVAPPNGGTGLILNITNYSPITDIRINGGSWISYLVPFSPWVYVGNHTMEIRDANGCIALAHVSVGNDFSASLSASPYCFQGSATLTATTQPSASSLVGPLTYRFYDPSNVLIPGPPTSNTRTITTGGVYTVNISDQYGCSAIATTKAVEKPTISISAGSCAPTQAVVTVTGGNSGSNYQYSLNGGPFQSSNTFNITAGGVYTVTITNGANCTATKNFTVLGSNGCCFSPAQVANASKVIPHGYSVTQIFGPLSIGYSTPGDIIIEGDFYIDIPIQFSTCPNILLGPDAHIIVNPGQRIHVDNSTLRAGCNEMWKGITASDPEALIDIKKSTLQDMEDGVLSKNGARLNVRDNLFTRNNIGMQVIDADPGFDIPSGRCLVQRNQFTTDGLPLLPLSAGGPNPVNGEHGIKLIRCQKVEIGADNINFNAWDGNRFTKIFNGILIQPDEFSGQTDQYNIRANTFENIYVNTMTPFDKFNNAYSSHRGAAIFCPRSQHVSNTGHQVYIKGSDDDAWDFLHCDKAVVLNGINATIERTKTSHTLLNFLMGATDDHHYSIQYNWGEAIFYGLQFIGNTASASVYDNFFWTRNQPISISANSHLWPKGIHVQCTPGNNSISIFRNRLDHQSAGGEAIDLSGVGPRVYVGHNRIRFLTTQIVSIVGQNAHHYGIRVQKSEGSTIEENTINGQSNYQALCAANPSNRASTGIGLLDSPEFKVRCNFIDNTDDGFRIEGYCRTQPTLVEYNQFHDHKIPMHFLPSGGTDGTLGDIGTSWYNCNNTFSLGDDPVNWPSPHNMLGQGNRPVKLYKVSSCFSPQSERYYSDFNNPRHVLPGESWSSPNTGQCMYVPTHTDARYEEEGCGSYFESEKSEQGTGISLDENSISATSRDQKNDLNNRIKLYPNPSSGLVNIDYQINTKSEIQFFNISGQLVKTITLETGSSIIKNNLNLNQGIYIWKCTDKNKSEVMGKLIID